MHSFLSQVAAAESSTNSPAAHGSRPAVDPLSRLAEIEQLIDSVAASWHEYESILRGRGACRIGYEKSLTVVPLDDQTQAPIGPAFDVTGTDLSRGGLSFSHTEPIPYRTVAISFPEESGITSAFVVSLSWCRFNQRGDYQSGGRFLNRLNDLTPAR
jgi:hypothetical protein